MKRFFPIYPILLGIIWVLVTYSNNASILPSIGVVTMPLLVVTGIVAALWGLIQLLVKDWRKSALVVTVIFGLSIFHGYIRDYTEVSGIMMVPIWLVLMAAGSLVIIKLTRPVGRIHLTIIANVVCIAILATSLFGAVAASNVSSDANSESKAVAINGIHNPLPDIYYIIPDTYTSSYILEKYLGYDNGDFYRFLHDRGFYVNPNSYANYHHSILSISSVMNMRYWTDEELGNESAQVLGRHLLQNPVGDTVKEAGYTYIHIGSWWGFTSQNVRADIVPRFSSLKELDFTLYKMTLWYDLANVADLGGNRILREAHLRQLNNLVEVSKMGEPTFTFCHMILPHPPFLFDAGGNHVYGWSLPADEWQRMYLDQLEFTTTRLMQVIDEILTNSDVTPIIVLSADEGYAGPNWRDYWNSKGGLQTIMVDNPDLAIMRQGNLYAILNPYSEGLPVPGSPVNTFRYVFNSLFDSRLEYLPDRYFLKSLGKYEHKFIEITEELR